MFAFQDQVPSQEQFDAMNDAAFCDWWDAFEARVAETEQGTDGVDSASAARAASEAARWDVA